MLGKISEKVPFTRPEIVNLLSTDFPKFLPREKGLEAAQERAEAGPQSEGPTQRVTELVNKDIMAQLLQMGFPQVRAEKGLWLTGVCVRVCVCV